MLTQQNLRYSLDIAPLPWDSGIFGFGCAALVLTGQQASGTAGAPARELIPLLLNAKKRGIRFVTAKIPAEETSLVAACLSQGGKLVDSELTFTKMAPTSPPEPPAMDRFHLVKATNYWDDSLYQLAETVNKSRFFTDSEIPAQTALELWRQSIRNSCTGRADYSVFAFSGDHPAGLINVFERDGVSDIFLLAVMPEFQGQGLGQAMISFYQHALDREITTQVVETQLTNYAAQKLYANMGYRTTAAKHVVHFWL